MSVVRLIVFILQCVTWACHFTFVTANPSVTAFNLNMNDGEIILQFNQIVNASTFDATQIALQSSQRLRLGEVPLKFSGTYNAMSRQGNSTRVYFFMLSDDYAKLKTQQWIGRSSMYSYLTMSSGAVFSPNGTTNSPITNTSAFHVTEYIDDKSPPYVEYFDINMNSEQMVIEFSEPVNMSTFTFEGLALQSLSNVFPDTPNEYKPGLWFPPQWPFGADKFGNKAIWVKLVDENTRQLSLSSYSRRVIFLLGETNMNIIKMTEDLCTTASNCFLSGWKSFVNDTSGNGLQLSGFELINALSVSNYTADITSPTLEYWTLDLNNGTVMFHFSEVIRLDMFNYSAVVLSSSSDLSHAMKVIRLQEPLYRPQHVSANITFTLLLDQFNELKDSPYIGKVINNTYLALDYGVAMDTSLSRNLYLGIDASSTNANARAVRHLGRDSTRPILIDVRLDMTAQTLTLKFSELMNFHTFQGSSLILQSLIYVNKYTEMRKVWPTFMTISNSRNSDSLVLKFTFDGFVEIKLIEHLCRSKMHSFLSFKQTMIRDKGGYPVGNTVFPVSSGNGLMVNTYIPDLRPPHLVSWTLSMSTNELVLTLSEPMNLTKIDMTSVSFQSQLVPTRTMTSARLTASSVMYKHVLNYKLFVRLSYADMNTIKKQEPPLCSSPSNCFLLLSRNFGVDTQTYDDDGSPVENPVEAVAAPMISETLEVDGVAPYLISFDLDMQNRRLLLVFSEPVLGQRLNNSGITLYDSTLLTAATFTPSPFSVVEETVSETITFLFSLRDWHLLQSEDSVAQAAAKTFLGMAAGTVTDVSGNAIVGFGTSNGLNYDGLMAVSNYVLDVNVPVIDAFALNRTAQTMGIYFNVAVLVGYFNPSRFLFIYNGQTYALTNAFTLPPYRTNGVLFDISPIYSDMQNYGIGASPGTTFLYVSVAKAVVGASSAKVPNERMSFRFPLKEGQKIATFYLNMGLQTLVLELAVPLLSFTLSPSLITLVNTQGASYTLSGYSSVPLSDDGYFITMNLSPDDFAGIQSSTTLSEDASSLQLIAGAAALVDQYGFNMNNAQTVSCSAVIADRVPPVLQAFQIDFSVNVLTLFFSEPVLLSSINLKWIALTNTAVNASTLVYLNSSRITNPDLAAANVNLLLSNGPFPTDGDRLHLTRSIGNNVASTFIIAATEALTDTAHPPNFLTAVPLSKALQARTIMPDIISPKIISFDVDMYARTVTIYFDEAINASSNRPSFYTLWATAGRLSAPHVNLATSTTLLGGGGGSYAAGRAVTILLSSSDFDTIMRFAPELCTSSTNTYLSVQRGAVRDLAASANPVAETLYAYAINVNNFRIDTTSPKLLSFDVSLQHSYAKFHLDKVVECSATRVDLLHFQYASFVGIAPYQYTLSPSSAYPECNVSYAKDIIVYFGIDDSNGVKAKDRMLKTKSQTFVRLFEGAFADVFGNKIQEIIDGRAMAVLDYFPDTISPKLMGYTALNGGLLRLRFNEPVDLTSFTPAGFMLQNGVNFSYSYHLKHSVLFGSDGIKLLVQIDMKEDYYAVRANSEVFRFQINTFLSAASSAITDMSGNALEPIPPRSALVMGPIITNWDFSLSSGRLVLEFSERMASDFSPIGLSVQDSFYSGGSVNVEVQSTTRYMLTNGSNVLFSVFLADKDLNRIKYFGVAKSASTSWLTAPYALTSALALETTVPNLKSAPLKSAIVLNVRNYVGDVIRPVLEYGILNLHDGILTLVFDEPVLTSSFNVTKVTLLSSAIGSSATLSGHAGIHLHNLTNLVVNLTSIDLNVIKVAYRSAALDSIVMAQGAVLDFADNAYAGNDADSLIDIEEVVPDTIPPSLLSFDLDMALKQITLTFDEVVTARALEARNVHILSETNTSTAVVFTLTNYSVIGDSFTNVVTIDLGLYRRDALALDSLIGIAKDISTSFILVNGVEDMFMNARLSSEPFQATSFVADTISPELIAFDFVASTGSSVAVTFYFSEIISISTFSCADFSFASSASISPAVTLALVAGDCTLVTSSDSNVVQVTVATALSSSSVTPIGSGESYTFTFVCVPSSSRSTTDVYGNTLAPIAMVAALRVGPGISHYALDMNLGLLTILFTKPVDRAGTFNVSGIGFKSSVSQVTVHLYSDTTTLGPFLLTSPTEDDIASLQLSHGEVNLIKEIDPQPGKLFILSNTNALFDVYGVSLVPTLYSDAIVNSVFLPDTVRPKVTSLQLDMSTETVIFIFDEPIRAVTVDPTNMRIQQSALSMAVSRKLSGGGFVQVSKETLSVQMVLTDSSYIKLTPHLAKGRGDSYISFTLNTVADMAGNFITIQSAYGAQQVDVYTNDTLSPRLVTFGLNMNTGILVMNFSEPVLASDNIFNTSDIIFQSRFLKSQGYSYVLTGGTLLSPSGWNIVIQLTQKDLVAIKNTPTLCRVRQNTYIRISSKLTTDTSGNAMTTIPDGASMLCSKFVADSVSPTVVAITLDMAAGVISVIMSELIPKASIAVTAVTLLSSNTNDGEVYVLSTASLITSKSLFMSTINITISIDDLNTIKARVPLASSVATSWFAFASSFCKDTFGNPVQSIPSYAPMPVDTYIVNSVRPAVLSYKINMDAEYIEIRFSESIARNTIDLAQIIIQDNKVRRFGSSTNLTLAAASTGTDKDGGLLDIALDVATLTFMKYEGIGLNGTTSMLTWGKTFVADSAGNYLLPLWDGSIYGYTPLVPGTFVADTTSPVLQKWYLDRQRGYIHMFFDEPIHVFRVFRIYLYVDRPTHFQNATSVPSPTDVSYETQGTVAVVNVRRLCHTNTSIIVPEASFSITNCDPLSYLGKVTNSGSTKQELLLPLFLSMDYSAVRDRAQKPNFAVGVSFNFAMKEGNPDCSLCEPGYYVAVNCTAHSDRICRPCSVCPIGEWTRQTCSAFDDAHCQACKSCNYGQTRAAACGGIQDTLCRPCRVCDSFQYEAAPCSSSHDTKCNSCKVCTFATAEAAVACAVGSYLWWAQENCCEDEDGKKDTCRMVGLQDMYISARDGRHHWVYPDSTPRVEGYVFGEKF
eukprot:gene3287-6514_t